MPKGTNVNPDAGMVADFKKRVDDYAKLREKAANAAPVELQEKSKPAEIATAEKSMAQKVREAASQRKARRHLHARDAGDVPPVAEAAADERPRRAPTTRRSSRMTRRLPKKCRSR